MYVCIYVPLMSKPCTLPCMDRKDIIIIIVIIMIIVMIIIINIVYCYDYIVGDFGDILISISHACTDKGQTLYAVSVQRWNMLTLSLVSF